jgi:alpha-glucosidase
VGLGAGWYGSEDYDKGDATRDRPLDRQSNSAPLSVRATIGYAKQHGVGVWVYIDHMQAEKQRDILFPLYEKRGLAGVKIGFVNVGTQQNTAWLTETMRKAAEHHLMLDIHDQYRTTGYTYSAAVYTDDPTVKTATHVVIEQRSLTSSDVLTVALWRCGNPSYAPEVGGNQLL